MNSSSKPPADPVFPASIWETIREEMRNRVGKEEFSIWIQPLNSARVADDVLVIDIPSMVFYQGFINNYLHVMEQCKNDLGFESLDIRLNIENLAQDDHQQEEDRPPASKKTSQPFSRSLSGNGFLNSGYTFENFVRGASNQFAYASCQNVAEGPGQNYNPLFIYGHTGLGKTHLLHAVGNVIKKTNADAVITYISSERFMNEMIHCLRFNKMWDFRQKYRHCDVFLVDDIQFISGKKATQEEFFHTFNSLYEAKKQIVMTSDQYPQDIPDIKDRLRNRFRWGLIADLQPPDLEHRVAILFSKSDQLGVRLTTEVAEYIARRAKRNVRELEGALHRIAAFSTLQGRPMDIQLAVEIFRHVFDEPHAEISIETIQKTVADHFNLKTSDMKSKKRKRVFSVPRQIAMYLARTVGKASYPEIGDKFGGKDHTTVMYAHRKIQETREDNLELKGHLETIERSLERCAR